MKRENKATINCDLFCLQTELTVIWGTTGGQYINNGAIINKQVSPQANFTFFTNISFLKYVWTTFKIIVKGTPTIIHNYYVTVY